MGDFGHAMLANSSSTRVEADTCLILQYHRIALLRYDPLQLAVEPYKFESQMEYLSNTCNIMPIHEMNRHLEAGRTFRPRSVVLTFDGGYADTLYNASEILDRYRIFATVFCTSANIIKNRQFWWDSLEDYLIAGCVGEQIELEIDNQLFEWPLRTQADRFRAYGDLYSCMTDKTPLQQQGILDQISKHRNNETDALDNHKIMDGQELKQLAESDYITIGGYTHNCVKLSSLSQWQQREEIVKNKTVLEELLARDIDCFSYPFGNSDDNDGTKTVEILKDAGFQLACGNSYGVVSATPNTDRYDLPRARVGNCNLYAFHSYLERFFG